MDSDPPSPITAAAVLRYHLFDRDAVRAIAASPGAIAAAAVLVLAAGLARDYDGEDLLAEPWHVFGGLAISAIVSTVLAGLLWLMSLARGDAPRWLSAWPRFVGLFWMTAPMAWLYAIPWERWCEPLTATRLNLVTLAAVSAWRVSLITLAGAVVFGLRKREAFPAVGLVSAAAMWMAASRLPILQIMGGVRRSDSERLLAEVGAWLMLGSILLGLTCMPWLAGTFVRVRKDPPVDNPERLWGGRVARSGWVLAIASLLAGLALLPLAQDEQRNRRRFADLLRSGEQDEAVAFAAGLTEGDLPPHWDPLPFRSGPPGVSAKAYRMTVLAAAARQGVPDWLIAALKVKAWPQDDRYSYSRGHWRGVEPERLVGDAAALWSLAETDAERDTLVASLRVAVTNEETLEDVVRPLLEEWGHESVENPSTGPPQNETNEQPPPGELEP